ncbi:hypothetical protein [Legionella nagasakiensis]|uniref:hypothetical protein n=1 Tax=Legionella nagasakiensis TaxID=535290 RepID=UPI001054EC5B|nr:hypothetical protein [Legionella nagasakiensis]
MNSLSKKRLKKLPYYLALLLLTTGASLIIGFLSFGGMYALWPVLPLAFATFGLSVAYEGEIYLQNIKGALNKLFKHQHLERQLAKEYLLEQFPDTTSEDCPQFFKDYEVQLNLLHAFGHHRLDKASLVRKKQVEKTLRDMEKWFAAQLFAQHNDEKELTAYELELRNWLAHHEQEKWLAKRNQRQNTYLGVKLFSGLAGLFMGLGTTYLLVEAFSTIPFIAAISFTAWPLFIVPMAIVAGSAYALLTYNAVTDMIANDTLRKWYRKIRDDLSHGLSIRNVFIASMAVVLVALALALTICTAGTWWTVAKEARPLFTWMGRMPGFIMGVINPLITGLSAVVFNLQNTSESLEMIDDVTRTKGNVFSRMWNGIKHGFNYLQQHENWLQRLNPFRLLLKITLTPLRILLFFGHLISIGVTSDRVPGIPQIVSALLGIISEGFEDAHYFVSQDHDDHEHHDAHEHTKSLLQERLGEEHGHNHDADLPTRFLKLLFSPIYFLAASWDYLTSKMNQAPRQSITFVRAWEKQMGLQEEKTITLPDDASRPSSAWTIEHALYRIERHKEKQLQGTWVGQDIAQEKSKQLTQLQQDIRRLDTSDKTAVSIRLVAEKKCDVYHKHRFFNSGPTSTAAFIEELPQRIASPTA